MRNILFCLLIPIFAGCTEFPHETNTTHIFSVKKCIVEEITYKGFHSTIEPNPYWEITTDCGFKFSSKQVSYYKIGDTITYYIKKTENEKFD